MKDLFRVPFFFFASCLIFTSNSNAQEDSPYVGDWQSDNGSLFRFFADGRLRVEMPAKDAVTGAWKKSAAEGKVAITLKKGVEVSTMDIDVTVAGDVMTFAGDKLVRVRALIDREKLVGRWKGEYETEGIEEYYLIIRRKDGSGLAAELSIDHERKIYNRNDGAFDWKVVGSRYIEMSGEGEDAYETVYGSFSFVEDKMHYKYAGEGAEEDEEIIEDVRTTELDLRDPPAGYKRVDFDTFYDE